MISIKELSISFLDIDGKLHRKNGVCEVYKNGFGSFRVYYIHGKLHNGNGPAVIYRNGKDRYYIDDIMYTKEQYHEKMGVF